MKQWTKLFRTHKERIFTFSVIFAGETFDIELNFKAPSGYVEFEYRPRGMPGLSDDQLDLQRVPRSITTDDSGFQWKQFTLHCPDNNCDEFEIHQKHGATAQSINDDSTPITSKFGTIDDIKKQRGNETTIYNKDGTVFGSVYPFQIQCTGTECIIKYVINPDAINHGKNVEYFVKAKSEEWRQYVDYTVAPLRWTQSFDEEFKNASGTPQYFTHVDHLSPNQRINLVPNYWHVIEMHVPGKQLHLRSKLEGEQYFRTTDPNADRKYVIVDKNGKEAHDQTDRESFDVSKYEKTSLHKGKIFGGLSVGGKKTEMAIHGKPSKNVINFSPEGDEGIVEKKQDGTVVRRRQIKTHHGMFVFSLTFGEKGKERKATGYVHYVIDTKPKLVYRTVQPLGSGKLTGSQRWPIRSNNAYVFGTNQEFKKKINKNMNVVSFPMVQGMPNSIQIQCVDKCPTVKQWLFNIKNVDDKTASRWSLFVDRQATAPSKWAAINEKYGFYVLNKLDYKEKLHAKTNKNDLNIKTTTINSNPWSAFKRIKFQVWYHGNPSDNAELVIDDEDDKLIMEFDVNIIEWHGAGKFWAGLFALIAIIVAQVFSCWYMAKRNAQKKSL